jgi:hypothetical protein
MRSLNINLYFNDVVSAADFERPSVFRRDKGAQASSGSFGDKAGKLYLLLF